MSFQITFISRTEITISTCLASYFHVVIQYTLYCEFARPPTFPNFNLSGFEREPLKLCKQMISHFVALDVGSKICQAQLCSSIRRCHRTSLLKSTLFKEEVTWQPLMEQESCSSSILEPLTKTFKWGIVCLSTIITSENIGSYVKKRGFYIVKMDIFWHNY